MHALCFQSEPIGAFTDSGCWNVVHCISLFLDAPQLLHCGAVMNAAKTVCVIRSVKTQHSYLLWAVYGAGMGLIEASLPMPIAYKLFR